MIENIPKPIADLALRASSRPIDAFSELISLKFFGKTNARLKAEAENEYQKTIQKGEIEREVSRSFIVEAETTKAVRQYSNMGNTLLKSAPLITSEKNTISNDNDVFWGLLEHSKEISNEKMQDLISKIIAGEYNSPETYSMSTLQTLKMLGKRELEMFERLSSLVVNGTQIPALLFLDSSNIRNILGEPSLDFASLQMLQNIGLILPNQMKRNLKNLSKAELGISYFDEKIMFKPLSDDVDVTLPDFYGLSTSGEEIIKHLNPKKMQNYITWLKDNYKVTGYEVIK